MESPEKPAQENPQLATLHAVNSRLKFRHFKLLIAVQDMGSAHQAATLLHMSQPGVSKALKEIEETLGTVLFARTPQGLVATDMGQCVIRHARLMLSSLAHMHNEMAALSRAAGVRISVGTIAGALAAVVADALLRFQKQHPDVVVDLHEGTSADLLEGLQSGTLDIALCRTSVATQSELFHFEWLSDEEASVVVSPVHPLAFREQVTLQEAAQYPWILFPGHMPLRTLLEREAASLNVSFHRKPIETSSTFATALLLNKSPDLVALMSRETQEFFEKTGSLRRLNLAIRSSAEPYGMVVRQGVQTPAIVGSFKECIKAQARQIRAY
ncbi:LysR substrate-binding domain-containing protein [Lampropedia aestuarii]|uniref:LysR substrate-binding domain-containing protein n=1 Tax=Lampropedia aestuarii TaxID=2562762 RepID=UPI002469471F|nr:LysR substrate-binding domain-containing protein [Lampropedia aestuarii]MDH5856658.1 LysR substrate-binding domain-containing protein [Lampropedia aestuarii]